MTIESPDATNVADAGTDAIGSTESPAQPVSMDDTLRNAYRQSMAKATADEPVLEGETTPGRARGPDGKFVRNGAANSVSNGVTPPEQAAAPETPVEPPTAPKPHDAAPNTWRKELAAEFGKLPENVRQEIHRRESDFHKGIGQYKEAATFASSMARELLPYQQTMQQHNKQPNEVVREATAAWNMLLNGTPQEKSTFWLQIAKDYGIDTSQLGTAPQQDAAGQTQDDPRLAAALQRLDKLETHLTTQERQRAEAEFSTHVDAVNAFGADPKNKHFNAVREHMAALIESGGAKDIQDAYDNAIWSNPEGRASLLAEQEQERAKKVAAEAAKARQAAGANVTRRGTPPVQQKAGSMDDTLKARYRELTT